MAKILLVDDDAIIRDRWRKLLINAGYTVIPAGRIAIAMNELAHLEFDLVIIGGSVESRLDGFNFARHISQMQLPKMPQILIASAEPKEDTNFQRLIKPVESEDLLARVDFMLNPH